MTLLDLGPPFDQGPIEAKSRTHYGEAMRKLLLTVVIALLTASMAHAADAASDAYLTGYAKAVLERQLQAGTASLRVDGGVVSLDAADLRGADRARVIQELSRIPGVTRVAIREAGAPAIVAATPPSPVTPRVIEDLSVGFLPGGHLFRSLIADPRWPHFAASYQYYLNERPLGSVAAVSFGESFTLYRDKIGHGWWEAGIQAGVFAFFDLEAESKDLINADYMVAATAAYRYDKFSALARLFHQSSHLGDEFVLANRVKNRVNLSYEAVDLRLSYDFFGDALRLYGGGGYLFDQEPAHLKPWSVQSGVEFRSPWPGPGAMFRPIGAVDVQYREENNWHADVSIRAGVEFQSFLAGRNLQSFLAGRNLQLMIEYFRGHSPNGHFYKEKIDSIGLGLHFNF
jgi:hypothetical protein